MTCQRNVSLKLINRVYTDTFVMCTVILVQSDWCCIGIILVGNEWLSGAVLSLRDMISNIKEDSQDLLLAPENKRARAS